MKAKGNVSNINNLLFSLEFRFLFSLLCVELAMYFVHVICLKKCEYTQLIKNEFAEIN